MLRSLLIPAIALSPSVPLLLLAYVLRPQGGRMRPNPVPVAQIRARIADEIAQGLIPASPFGDTSRPATWTVPTRELRTA